MMFVDEALVLMDLDQWAGWEGSAGVLAGHDKHSQTPVPGL